MKAYKVTLLVIDYDSVGEAGIRDEIENANYPNDCISPRVKEVEGREIGTWYDDHPLNVIATSQQEYERLFQQPTATEEGQG